MLSYLRGREARPASRGWNVLKTSAQIVVFWSVFLVLFPAGVLALEKLLALDSWRFSSPAATWCGSALFVLGSLLGLTSGVVMAAQGYGTPMPTDCPRKLVVVGPYRYIRNPMAVAGLLQGVAVGIFLGSPAVIAYALTGGPVWNWLVRPWEEADLTRRFGASYRHYRESVRCWIPSLRGYLPNDEVIAPNESLDLSDVKLRPVQSGSASASP